MMTKMVILNLDKESWINDRDFYIELLLWNNNTVMVKDYIKKSRDEIIDILDNLLKKGFTRQLVELIQYTLIKIHSDNIITYRQGGYDKLFLHDDCDSMLILSGKGFPLMHNLVKKEIKSDN
ncbi:MAG: hypothetical protein ACOCZ5_01715 [bacterium]